MADAAPPESHVYAYYRAALAGLRFVDRTRRRFGVDADALWRTYAGDPPILPLLERIDLLLRDADVEWQGRFGARTVFEFTEVGHDDAFGNAWPKLSPWRATVLWAEERPRSLLEMLTVAADAWGIAAAPVELGPAELRDRLVLTSVSAVVAAAVAFAAQAELVWNHRVVVVAGAENRPALRQIAFLAGVALRSPTVFADAAPPGWRVVDAPDVTRAIDMGVDYHPDLAPPAVEPGGEVGGDRAFEPCAVVEVGGAVCHPWGGRVVVEGDDNEWYMRPAIASSEPGPRFAFIRGKRSEAVKNATALLLFFVEGRGPTPHWYGGTPDLGVAETPPGLAVGISDLDHNSNDFAMCV